MSHVSMLWPDLSLCLVDCRRESAREVRPDGTSRTSNRQRSRRATPSLAIFHRRRGGHRRIDGLFTGEFIAHVLKQQY
jgi:hypothetical protein